LKIDLVLVRARFALTLGASREMIEASWVYLNSIVVTNLKTTVQRHDFIQMPVTPKYFIYFRWMYSWMLKRKSKLMPRVIMIAEARRSEKPRKVPYPDWILQSRYTDEDIPNYLEVDFLSMSIAVLTLPLRADEFDPYLISHLNVYTPKMLNWKYIT
jgi:ribosomal protein S4